ncbi:hypothetical protein BDC45DRAFT_100393 [Circinella umbellata]|nr:hypothetical protein BDC45DRAFT_100393 [Circinella umbellata]
MFFLAAFSFTVDRLLSYPYSKLSIVLKGLVLPSVMLCSTVIIGALTYMTLEDWTYSKSILFCWTGITTIGYGDITPSSSKGRIFFLLYTVFGISIVGYMLLSIRAVITGTSSDIMKVNLMRVESLHDYSRHQRQKWMNQQNCRQQLFDNTNNNSNSPTTPLLERRYSTPIETPITGREDDITDHTNDHDNTYSSNLTSPYPNYNNNNDKNFQGRGPRSLSNVSTFSTYTIAGILNNKDRQILVQVITKSGIVKMGIILIICWFGGAGIFCSLEKDWSYLDGLYFVFGTQLTIGFGDIVPQTAVSTLYTTMTNNIKEISSI